MIDRLRSSSTVIEHTVIEQRRRRPRGKYPLHLIKAAPYRAPRGAVSKQPQALRGGCGLWPVPAQPAATSSLLGAREIEANKRRFIKVKGLLSVQHATAEASVNPVPSSPS